MMAGTSRADNLPRIFPIIAALGAAILPLIWLTGCNSVFFQPDRKGYYHPEQFNLRYQDVYFENREGMRLTGWYFPAQGKQRGTVIHFHGNAANISNHLPGIRWLPAAGYSVFMFDYRGYGISEGSPTRAGVIADGVAAMDYVRGRPDVDPERLIVYGQSLGGAVAIGALARAGTKGVRALVVEGAFGSYREVSRLIMNDIWFAWPFQYPAAYLFFSDELRPYDDLPKLAHIPFLVIHGQQDNTVPIESGRRLVDAFPGPDKTFWSVPNAGHISTFMADTSSWRKLLLHYLEERMAPTNRSRNTGRFAPRVNRSGKGEPSSE